MYKLLSEGRYHDGQRLRGIKYDASKPAGADMGPIERALLKDVKLRGGAVSGTQQIRAIIGQSLFGATVECGLPIFMTVSPTMRHSALCVRLSRYRQHAAQAGVWAQRDFHVGNSGRAAPGLRREETFDIPRSVVCTSGFRVRPAFSTASATWSEVLQKLPELLRRVGHERLRGSA